MQQRLLRPSVALSLLSLLTTASSWYIPGIAPTTYSIGEQVPLHVNRLTPSVSVGDGQVHSVLSFDYYAEPFHFCKPENGPRYITESLGSIIFGDRIQTSPFVLHMAQDEMCKAVPDCGMQKFEAIDAKFVNKRIWQGFNINWLVDGLPAGQVYVDQNGEDFYSPGFELGEMVNETPIFHNHFDIKIEIHKVATDKFRVVGIIVTPMSNKNAVDMGSGVGECEHPSPLTLNEDGVTEVGFTYSVTWVESDTSFATRWDKYLHVYDPKIHWFSLVNAAVIVIFLSAMVFVILVRTLRKDISRYNRLDEYVMTEMNGNGNGNGNGASIDDMQEDSGWKLVHGDVFRPPGRLLLLSILVGNGAQLFMMAGCTIGLAMLGFLSPSNRGILGTAMVVLYTLFGSIGGFVSGFTYKCMGGEQDKQFKQNMVLTPTLLPATVFGTFFLLNLFLWAKGSSGAVPFTTMLIIVLMWFIISVPLSLAGSWLAFKRPAVTPPVRTNQIPRQIPDALGTGIGSWLNRPVPAMLLTGILPFAAIFVEIHFIMASLWSAKIYYMFGFLFVCYGLMILTCATVTVLSIYFVLCAEDYRWQWRSFATSGACAIYVFINAMIFWASRLSFSTWTSGVLYLGYSALISLLVFVLTGTVGFFASWVFVHRIYRSIKVD